MYKRIKSLSLQSGIINIFTKNKGIMKEELDVLEQTVSSDYKYGFVTEIDTDVVPKGLSEDVIRLISEKKNEPEWMLNWRLKAYAHWLKMEEPKWPNVHYPPSITRILFIMQHQRKKSN